VKSITRAKIKVNGLARFQRAHCIGFAVALLFNPLATQAQKIPDNPFRLVQTIPLAGVQGRIDHLAVDLPRRRLFVCALGNNTVEVIPADARSGAIW
jgi:hypothetical protein